MSEEIKFIKNNKVLPDLCGPSDIYFEEKEEPEVIKFHKSFDCYQMTPLVRLKALSESMGLKEILVKDESCRFNLNSFKVLGSSYGIAKSIAKKLAIKENQISMKLLKSDEIKRKLQGITFVAATDGNHGLGVAWMAQILNCKAIIYMPKDTTANRIDNILRYGAEVHKTQLNYDDTVSLAIRNAKVNGWEIIQDTAWDGYTEIPEYIMQGYTTMAFEIIEQISSYGINEPTHIFLQAGVGSFAAAITNFFVNNIKRDRPLHIVVESKEADCFVESAISNSKDPKNITGPLNTIMAGLACGRPNPLAWDILKEYADFFISVSDDVSIKGMHVLGNPLKSDCKIISGESGAVTAGLLSTIMQDDAYKGFREELKLNENSIVLLFNTEGDTDTDVYKGIMSMFKRK